ncbi:MAG: polyphosphate polymerase domain-containing protein [Lachnospiraceae bacterium]|nr:polyphosphate polymerase domain-containing protein [Lachnospiraceae bacterium]
MQLSERASFKLINMRHEEKFLCSERELTLLDARLKAFLTYDSNQDGADYQIRSLYFDTFEDRLYKESLNGIERRHKYRIRFYNMNDSFFRFERKDTIGRLKQKQSAPFTKKQVEQILNGEGLGKNYSEEEALLQEVYSLQRTEGLHPVVVVDYHRTAYTYPIGNIRITLDRNISCTHRIEEFLDTNSLLYPLLPENRHVLEVKYDGCLPGYIASLLNIAGLEQISFSKYAYSREIIENNGRK